MADAESALRAGAAGLTTYDDEEGTGMARDRAEYEAMLAAVGVCVATRIPFLLWGEPGAGKTAVVESAARQRLACGDADLLHYEPSDFAGLPVVDRRPVTLAPPGWARRGVAAGARPSIVFFDEWTTASPAVQAAALRPLTHGEVGALRLPERVSFGAAANPADVAASGWELAAPTANRFVHLDWAHAAGRVRRVPRHRPVGRTRGAGPRPRLRRRAWAAPAALVAGFLRARGGQLSAIPKDAASRGRAFPTPRTWDYAARLLAAGRQPGRSPRCCGCSSHGAIGAPTGHEFLAWVRGAGPARPGDLLADPGGDRLRRACAPTGCTWRCRRCSPP